MLLIHRVVRVKANCGKRLGNKKDGIQMYINVKWCTGGKNNLNSIYKTTGSELSVTIWNVGVVTDCVMEMSVQWSVAIKKINGMWELPGENRAKQTIVFPPAGVSGETVGCAGDPGALRLLWVTRGRSWRLWVCAEGAAGPVPPGKGTFVLVQMQM